MYGYNMATSYHLGNSKLTVSPASTVVKAHMNSPMSPMTPNKKDVMVTTTTTTLDGASSKCKRKINFNQIGLAHQKPMGGDAHQPPATVARRNARERNRVKQVNNGFAALKQHIPLGHRSKKMSKVETLKCAVDYIRSLTSMLDANGQPMGEGSSSSSGHHQDNYAMQQQQYNNLAASVREMANHYNNQLSPSTSSEDPASPSYASEASYVTSTVMSNSYDCENYEPVSPEDEELLDAISWWQQS